MYRRDYLNLKQVFTVSNLPCSNKGSVGGPEKGAESFIPPGPPVLRFDNQKILVADDNPDVRAVLVELLANAGLNVTTVCDGAEAVDIISRNNFDLVLMDIEMPIMDGLTAARKIRELDRPGVRSLPVLAITANTCPEDMEKSFRAGMNSHITKPFTPDAVIHEVHRFLCMKEEIRPENAGQAPHGHPNDDGISSGGNPLDIPKGIRLVGGDRALYEELLRRFVLEYRKKGEETRHETEQGNYSKAAYIAYAVKEIACLLAAGPLQSAAARLESELKCVSICSKPLLERFEMELSRVMDFYRTNIQNQSGP